MKRQHVLNPMVLLAHAMAPFTVNRSADPGDTPEPDNGNSIHPLLSNTHSSVAEFALIHKMSKLVDAGAKTVGRMQTAIRRSNLGYVAA